MKCVLIQSLQQVVPLVIGMQLGTALPPASLPAASSPQGAAALPLDQIEPRRLLPRSRATPKFGMGSQVIIKTMLATTSSVFIRIRIIATPVLRPRKESLHVPPKVFVSAIGQRMISIGGGRCRTVIHNTTKVMSQHRAVANCKRIPMIQRHACVQIVI